MICANSGKWVGQGGHLTSDTRWLLHVTETGGPYGVRLALKDAI